MTFSPSAGFKD